MIKMFFLISIVLLSCLVMTNLAEAQGLIGWWKLDDGAGTTAVDSSGNSKNGNVQGNGVWVEGKIGGAMQFNGSDTYIRAPGLPLANHNFTITIWIYPTELKGNHTIISQGRRAENRQMQIRAGGPDALYNVPVQGFRYGFCRNNTDTPAGIIQTNMWYHVACTYDFDKRVRMFYLNGVEVAQDKEVSPFIERTGALILGAAVLDRDMEEYFSGILDDIRIYDRVLAKEEIYEVASSKADSQYQSMYDTIEKAKSLTEEQKFKEAKSLLEKEISKYEQSLQQNQDKGMSSYAALDCQLHYLHGLAGDALGDKKNIVAEDFKKAVSVDLINPDKNIMGDSLLWLFQNMKKDYNNVVNPLLDKNSYFLKTVVAKSETMISNNQAPEAINFLDANINSYEQWREEHPFDEVIAEDMLPEIYFQLAISKEATKAPEKNIAEAYRKTFNLSSYDYIPERTAALIWLAEHNCTEELKQVIKPFTQEQDIQKSFKDIISGVCRHFELEKKGNGAKSLLDTLFKTAKYPSEWAVLVESCIINKTSQLAKAYYSFLESAQTLKFSVDCKLAEKLVSEERYKEAAVLYKDILIRCESDDIKSEIHFCLLKSLFDGDIFSEAVTQIDNFISSKYKGTTRKRVKEAMLMKGRSLFQLGEVDKAIDVFSSIMIEYPDTGELPETTFFIGYSYMLQGEFKQAIEAFEIVCRSHSDSEYAEQAEKLLGRIKEMTNEE